MALRNNVHELEPYLCDLLGPRQARRARNAVARQRIRTILELYGMGEARLCKVRNIGATYADAFNHVYKTLQAEFGASFLTDLALRCHYGRSLIKGLEFLAMVRREAGLP